MSDKSTAYKICNYFEKVYVRLLDNLLLTAVINSAGWKLILGFLRSVHYFQIRSAVVKREGCQQMGANDIRGGESYSA
jgi:uncharacterized protein YpbB